MSVPSHHTPRPSRLRFGSMASGIRRMSSTYPSRDRGFTLADGVFETMRVRNGRVFRLDRHLSRLADALARLSIPASPDLKDWLLAAVRASSPDDASVRLTVTRGVGPLAWRRLWKRAPR